MLPIYITDPCGMRVELVQLRMQSQGGDAVGGRALGDASPRQASRLARETERLCRVMADLASRIVGHYAKHAVAWDADRRNSHWNDKIWHDRFIARLGNGAQVLDLGCGSGRPVAQHMAELGLRVTGVDSSPTMISLCRERLPDQEWIVGDMRRLALDRHFDGILAWDSFFHLNYEDQRRMFPIFADHASAGTVLMCNTGPQHGEAVGEYKGDPLYHASLSPSEYRALIGRFGFAVMEHATNDAAAGGRTVWLCRRRALG
jgi:SAM-dependent methyltransferase